MEEKERKTILDANNTTMDNFFQYPVMNNKKGENANMVFTSERQITLDMLA